MASRVPGSFRLLHAFGIDVFVHWSWLVVAVIWYQFAAQGQMFSHALWYAAVYVALFAIVTLHEFGHALACKSVGGQADTIVLWPLGGVAFVQPPPRPGATLWSIAAGPLVNLVLVPVFLLAAIASEASVGQSGVTGSDLATFLAYLFGINALLLVFNMLPIYPLDGGQILQSILWFMLGRTRSLKVAAAIGLGVAVVAAVPLILMQEWWLFILALFIGWQAWSGYQYARRLGQVEAQWRTG